MEDPSAEGVEVKVWSSCIAADAVASAGNGATTAAGAGVIGIGDAVAENSCGGGGGADRGARVGDANGIGVPVRGIPINVADVPPGVVPGARGGAAGRGNAAGALGFVGGLGGAIRGGRGAGRGGNGGGACVGEGVPPTSVPARRVGGVGVAPSGPGDSGLGQSPSPASGFALFSGPFPSFRSATG